VAQHTQVQLARHLPGTSASIRLTF
jgi:hypothetical protein